MPGVLDKAGEEVAGPLDIRWASNEWGMGGGWPVRCEAIFTLRR